jgi:iron complex outermembrane recepter protein
MHRSRRVLFGGLVAATLLGAQLAYGQATYQFDLPAESLADSLRAVGRLTHINVLFDPPLIDGRQAPALKGHLTVKQAFTRLLTGTQLRSKFLDDATVTIAKETPTPTTLRSDPSDATASGRASLQGDAKAQPAPAGSAGAPEGVPEQTSSAAQSQTIPAQTAQAAAEPSVQEVVVTGSRIAVPPNIGATSPMTVVTSQDFQLQGVTDTTDMINRLPQNIISNNTDLGNNSPPLNVPGGITTADLRGLGPQRTLVLVDGMRLGPGDPNTANPNQAADLDQIPAQLIQRVEVVTGGASATYGSDAIAGVINFIMKKDFEGFEVGGNYGFYMHTDHEQWATDQQLAAGFTPAPSGTFTDGEKRDFYVLAGTNLADGGNITTYFTYHQQDPVTGSQRDFANCELVSNADFGGPPTSNLCIGSENSNQFIIDGAPYSVVGHEFLPYPQAGSVPPPTFNSSAYEYMQRQDQRYNAGAFAHLEVSDEIKPYLEFSYMNDKTTIQVAPSGLFESDNPLTPDNQYLVNCSNPLLSAQERSTLCTPAQIAADSGNPGSASADINIGRRNVEGGGRIAYYEHTNFRVVGGSTGDLGDAWTYNLYGQFAYTTFFNDNENYLNFVSITNALQVTTGPNGAPACISGGSCVPWNIFNQGGVTAAQLAYLYTPGTAYGQNWEEVEHADVTGELGKYGIVSPFAKDGVGVNLGVEHRMESLNYAPDAAELSGDLSGFGGAAAPIDKSYDVSEGFAEFRAPLAQDLPGVHDLTLDGGYRFSHYSTAGVTNTFKVEIQYAPTEDVRLRSSFDRAIRAPNLIDLYNPESYGEQSFVGVDPCAPTVGAGGVITGAATASLAECAHTGVTPAQYGNGNVLGAVYHGTIPQCVSDECGEIVGGNPNLQPEVANTFSVGLTFTPTELRGLTGSIDYYHIALSNVITSVPGAFVFSQCLQTGALSDCQWIVRNPVTGALTGATVAGGGYIVQTNTNIASEMVSGIDVQVDFRRPLADTWGTLVASLSGSWLQHTETAPAPGAPSFDCAGLFGATCDQSVNPKWRHNLRLSWETPWDHLMLSSYWRFISATTADNNSSQPALHYVEVGSYDSANARIGSVSYFDLAAIWPITHQFEVSLVVNNVLDKDPPIVSVDYNGGTIPYSFPAYDFLGREFELGARYRF